MGRLYGDDGCDASHRARMIATVFWRKAPARLDLRPGEPEDEAGRPGHMKTVRRHRGAPENRRPATGAETRGRAQSVRGDARGDAAEREMIHGNLDVLQDERPPGGGLSTPWSEPSAVIAGDTGWQRVEQSSRRVFGGTRNGPAVNGSDPAGVALGNGGLAGAAGLEPVRPIFNHSAGPSMSARPGRNPQVDDITA